MTTLSISHHGRTRLQQRGLRVVDINLILECATQIGSDVYFMSGKDCAREIARRKHEIQEIERLRNQKVVVAGSTIITAYKSCRRDQKRMLHGGKDMS